MPDNPFLTLQPALVEKTRQGRVTDWTERMSVIAKAARLPLSHICWDGSPEIVAFNVVDTAKRMGHLDALRLALENLEPSKVSGGQQYEYCMEHETSTNRFFPSINVGLTISRLARENWELVSVVIAPAESTCKALLFFRRSL